MVLRGEKKANEIFLGTGQARSKSVVDMSRSAGDGGDGVRVRQRYLASCTHSLV